ncbi:terpene synthase-like [Xylocopa sonorina]|uniref:terpene synthase-like n=1 Tax=Xylocopa sonorina TaxID=1818115 RepID=UPI00403AA01C
MYQALGIFSEQFRQITRGQGIELYWKDNCICPTKTEFNVMAVQKCGIFYMIARLMPLFSDYKKDITIMTGLLTLYFQIRNDYYNLFVEKVNLEVQSVQRSALISSVHSLAKNRNKISREYIDTIFILFCYTEGKGNDDIEGYFNFLTVHAIQTGPEGKEVMNIFKQKTKYIKTKRYCVSLLKKCGTYAYTRTVLEELDKKIREEVEHLGGNPLFDKLLDDLYSWKDGGDYLQPS